LPAGSTKKASNSGCPFLATAGTGRSAIAVASQVWPVGDDLVSYRGDVVTDGVHSPRSREATHRRRVLRRRRRWR
jgi:hypothetical protein